MIFYFIGIILLISMALAIPKPAFRYNKGLVSFIIILYSAVFLYLLSVQPVANNRYNYIDVFPFAVMIGFLTYRPYTFSLVNKKEYYLDFEIVHKSIVLLVLFIYIYFRRMDIGLVWNIGIKAWVQTTAFMFLLIGVITYIAIRTKLLKKVKFIKTDAREFYVTTVNMFFFVALPEEVFFRGLLYGFMLHLTGNTYIAIAMATLVFSICHMRYGLQMVILGGMAGLFYNVLYVLTGNIYCVTIMHVAVNLYRKYFLK